jgi:hypothetical protein
VTQATAQLHDIPCLSTNIDILQVRIALSRLGIDMAKDILETSNKLIPFWISCEAQMAVDHR